MTSQLFGLTELFAVAMVALVLSFARAQQPSPSTSGIPEKAPSGMNQSDWNTIRERCMQLSAEVMARQHMTPEQLKNVQPFSRSDIEACMQMVEPPPPPAGSTPGRNTLPPPPPPPPPIPPSPPPPGASSLSP